MQALQWTALPSAPLRGQATGLKTDRFTRVHTSRSKRCKRANHSSRAAARHARDVTTASSAEGSPETNQQKAKASALAVLVACGLALNVQAAHADDIDELDFDDLDEIPTAGNVIATEANLALLAPAAPSVFQTLGTGAVASCTAEVFTLPLELVKVRVQLQGRSRSRSSSTSSEDEATASSSSASESPSVNLDPVSIANIISPVPSTKSAVEPAQYKGVVSPMKQIAQEEGVNALWKGLSPGLQHHFVSGGLRIGLYAPTKAAVLSACAFLSSGMLMTNEPNELLVRIVAGIICGVVSVVACNPTDVLKVRMQSEASTSDADLSTTPANPKPNAFKLYIPKEISADSLNQMREQLAERIQAVRLQDLDQVMEQVKRIKGWNPLSGYIAIAQEDGVLALWNGVVPNATRGAMITATELASYDTFKDYLSIHCPSMPNATIVAAAALGAGTIAGSFIVPVDLVKSRLMAEKGGAGQANFVEVTREIVEKEGVGALLQGMPASVARVGCFDVIVWLIFESISGSL
mmetsp:Transcript_3928/g.4414  ORF Transcript_3928/g.4414 Transcript_3928/m.4414 type:complete len:523 (+) Transcript_3928:639-2207(+)|eukprot:CAMPEP_0197855658 /NCGR_PEP_ID=MMETSP1438-20131217/27026_1 /TAXON_ID=1461541 /ORGANISM="Pterosperma sp., Strain CCMP1384" /LENGTH=522 /DNA_ID=CAMNT_0043470849 /DNA_START=621 /DNA_END=2189 /DNA_ORIENTATION=+